MRTQLVDFQGLASVEAVVSRLLLCYPLAVVRVCGVVVNVKFMECVVCSERKREKGTEGGVVFFFSLDLGVCLCLSFVYHTSYYAVPS